QELLHHISEKCLNFLLRKSHVPSIKLRRNSVDIKTDIPVQAFAFLNGNFKLFGCTLDCLPVPRRINDLPDCTRPKKRIYEESSKEIPFFSGKIDIGKADRKQIVCLINILIDKLSIVLVDSELYLRFQFIHILKRLKNRHCRAVQLFREISSIQAFNTFLVNDLTCLLQNQFLCNSLFRRHEKFLPSF